MKKIFIIILVTIAMLALSLQAFGADLEAGRFDYKIYNDIYENLNEKEGLVEFDSEDLETPMVIFKPYSKIYAFNLDHSFRRELVKAVDKYLEWNKKAIDKEVEIQKTISSKHMEVGFYSSDWHFDSMVKVEFRFFSQNVNRHQLVIATSEMTSSSNEYITANMDNIYLDKDEAVALKEMLTDEAIEDAKQEIKKQKKVEGEFN